MAREDKPKPSLKHFLNMRLIAMAVAVGIIMLGYTFVVVNQNEIAEEINDMSNEAVYQLDLLDAAMSSAQNIINALESENAPAESVQIGSDAIRKFAQSLILHGYDENSDGMLVISTEDGRVYATNSNRFEGCETLSECFPTETVQAIERSALTGEYQQVPWAGGAGDDSKTEEPLSAVLVARERNGVTATVIRPASKVFAEVPGLLVLGFAQTLVVIISIYALMFFVLDRTVVRRIKTIGDGLARVAAGDLDTRVELGETKEFESLASDINQTVDALKDLIVDAETRIDSELETARAIQESALPRIFPPYPDIIKFDIYATMHAARQVGGDFYDFFLIGKSEHYAGKLGFLVADVSGKGVPAALFMMKAKAQIRDYLENGVEIGEAIEEVNRQLYDGNDEGMFVTAWVGMLDYATGHVDYVNAGHNPPLLWQRSGGWRWLKDRSGPMLGLYEGRPYKTLSIDCQPGDTFLLYTDGVTEAFDKEEELYGVDRLMAVAEEGFRLHPRELVMSVQEDVAAYADGAEQSDDITILALEVGVPPEVTATLEVDALIDEITRVNGFLHAELDRRLCPSRVQNQLDIAVEELFVNVCSYAYPDAPADKPGTVRIMRTYHAEPASITVDIIDTGVPFNPLAKPDVVLSKNVEELPVGGLGIHLTKRVVDEIGYERVGDSNIVTIVKRW